MKKPKQGKFSGYALLELDPKPITRRFGKRIGEPDNERAYSLASDVREYRINDPKFAHDLVELGTELSGKPLEVLEIRINREILEYLRDAPTADKETQIKRKLLIQNLLTQYKFRSKDIDPAYKAHMQAFGVDK